MNTLELLRAKKKPPPASNEHSTADTAKYFFYAGSIFLISTAVTLADLWHNNKYTFGDFNLISTILFILQEDNFSRFGVWVTLTTGFILPFLLLRIPTETGRKIDSIYKGNGNPLCSTEEVFTAAYTLFKDNACATNTTISYTSSTPLFGLFEYEKNETNTKTTNWLTLLKERLEKSTTEENIKTNIITLSWEPFMTGRSALYSVCRQICNATNPDLEKLDYKTEILSKLNETDEIYEKALLDWKKFQDLYNSNETFKNTTNIYVSHRTYDAFIFKVDKGNESSECIIAVMHKDNDRFSMSGLHSKDIRWTSTASKIIDSLTTRTKKINSILSEDKRKDIQKKRDIDLLKHFCRTSHLPRKFIPITPEEYSFSEEIKIKIIENKYVYPFKKFVPGYNSWNKAIEKAFFSMMSEHPNTPKNKIIGIDINTGCGILAITLALHNKCNEVIAKEHDSKAMGNALMNFNRTNNYLTKEGKEKIHISFKCGIGLKSSKCKKLTDECQDIDITQSKETQNTTIEIDTQNTKASHTQEAAHHTTGDRKNEHSNTSDAEASEQASIQQDASRLDTGDSDTDSGDCQDVATQQQKTHAQHEAHCDTKECTSSNTNSDMNDDDVIIDESYDIAIITMNFLFYETTFCTINYRFGYEEPFTKLNSNGTQTISTSDDEHMYINDYMGPDAFISMVHEISETLQGKDIYILFPFEERLASWTTPDMQDNSGSKGSCKMDFGPQHIMQHYGFSRIDHECDEPHIRTYSRKKSERMPPEKFCYNKHLMPQQN